MSEHPTLRRGLAFEGWLREELRPNRGWMAMPPNAIARGRHLRMLLRFAWDAGAKYQREEPRP